jgi:hypothetical protein
MHGCQLRCSHPLLCKNRTSCILFFSDVTLPFSPLASPACTGLDLDPVLVRPACLSVSTTARPACLSASTTAMPVCLSVEQGVTEAPGDGEGRLSKVVLARRSDVDVRGRVCPLALLEALAARDPRAYQVRKRF